MHSYEWLIRAEEAPARLVHVDRVGQDDARWRAVFERVELAPTLRVYSHRIEARQALTISVQTTDTEPWTFCTVPSHGGACYRLADGPTIRCDARQGVLLGLHKVKAEAPFAAGARVAAFGLGIRTDAIEEILEQHLPQRRLGGTRPAASFGITPAMRALVERALASPLRGALRRLELEGLALHLLALVAAQQLESRRLRAPGRIDRRERAAAHEAAERLRATLGSPPPASELAAACGLTPRRLGEVFRALHGCSITAFVRNARLDLARHALEHEKILVKQIAYRLGYSHPVSFVRAFTARFGVSPARYAKSSREDAPDETDPAGPSGTEC